LRQCGPTPALDHSVMDDPVVIAELSNPAFLAADNSNDVAVFTAALMHRFLHGRGLLCFIKRRRQQLFSIRIMSSPKRHRDLVSSSFAALLAALECAQEAGAETIVEA